MYIYKIKINSTTHKAISIILPHRSHTRNQCKENNIYTDIYAFILTQIICMFTDLKLRFLLSKFIQVSILVPRSDCFKTIAIRINRFTTK